MDKNTSQSWKNELFQRESNLGRICSPRLRVDCKVSFQPIKSRLFIHLVNQNVQKTQMTKNVRNWQSQTEFSFEIDGKNPRTLMKIPRNFCAYNFFSKAFSFREFER